MAEEGSGGWRRAERRSEERCEGRKRAEEGGTALRSAENKLMRLDAMIGRRRVVTVTGELGTDLFDILGRQRRT